MMQNAIISHGKQKVDKMERRRELPCVRRSRSSYRVRVVLSAMPMSMERKKVIKKQRRSAKRILYGHGRRLNSGGAAWWTSMIQGGEILFQRQEYTTREKPV
jgi:hypothetical protein